MPEKPLIAELEFSSLVEKASLMQRSVVLLTAMPSRLLAFGTH